MDVIDPSISAGYYALAAALMLSELFLLQGYCRAGMMTVVQMFSIVFLSSYLFLVFASTVFCRTPGEMYTYELEVFWSYKRAFGEPGNMRLFAEDLLNVVMLLPEGFLLPAACIRQGRHLSFPYTVLTGFLTTVTIECLQLITKRGLFEFDDIINNTAGIVIGYGIYQLVRQKAMGSDVDKNVC